MEVRKAIGSHDPNEPNFWESLFERAHRVDRVGAAEPGFDIRNDHARALGECAGGGHALRQIGGFMVGLERVLRRNEPNHPIQLQSPLGGLRHVGMALVRRVERTSVKAHAHPRSQMESGPERAWPPPLRGASGLSRGPHTYML